MLLREYFGIARQRWWLLALGIILVPALWIALDVRQGVSYEATAAILVSPSESSTGSAVDAFVRSQDLVASYADLVTRRPVLSAAVERGDLASTVSGLGSRSRVDIVEDTSIIEVTVAAPDARDAITSVNAIAAVFVELAPELTGSNVVVLSMVEDAVVAAEFGPSISRDLILGMFFGAIAGLTAGFAWNEVDTKLRTKQQLLESAPDLNVLGSIPRVRRGQLAGPLSSDDGPPYEAFRIVGAAIKREMRNRGAQVVLVTSPLPGDGKTTVSMNLGAVLRTADTRTVLVDGDVSRASLASRMPLRDERTELIPHKVHVQSTALPGLYCVVASGNTTVDDLALAISLLRGRADYIVIDSPPVLPLADIDEIAESVDVAVIVASATNTNSEALSEAVARVQATGTPVLGAVLNKAEHTVTSYGYY